jgi:hypothetical protein
LRSHAKTGPFLPPSRLIARDTVVDPDIANNNMDGRSEAGSECKCLNLMTQTNYLFVDQILPLLLLNCTAFLIIIHNIHFFLL